MVAPAVRTVDQYTGDTTGDPEQHEALTEYWRGRANEQELRVIELATQLSEALDALKAARAMLDTMQDRVIGTLHTSKTMLDHVIARCDDA